MRVSRLAAAAAVAAVALGMFHLPAAAGAGGRADADRALPVDRSLRQLAAKVNLRVGTAVDMNAFNNDTQYRERIATEFSAVTAENVMKWSELEPQRGVYNWGPADQLVAAARRNGQLVHGHTLLWHNQLPAWLTEGVASGEIDAAELRQLVRKHIFDVVGHFKGRVWHWDVVNEVFDDPSDQKPIPDMRNTIFRQNLGDGYIDDALRWAHQADPKVKLYLNDYNVEGISAKSTEYYKLITRLKRDGVPIHGFGIQGHFDIRFGNWSGFAIAQNINRFAELGLEVSITEADVRMDMPPNAMKLNAQAQGYSNLLMGCLLGKRCVMFTVWGYTDKYSWVPGFFEGQGAANLLDENFQPKPAYDEVRAILALARHNR